MPNPSAPPTWPPKLRAVPPAKRKDAIATSPLAHLPTEEEIAAEIQRRPISAVLADICRDLGIMPNDPLWREIEQVMFAFDPRGVHVPDLLWDLVGRLDERWLIRPIPPPPFMTSRFDHCALCMRSDLVRAHAYGRVWPALIRAVHTEKKEWNRKHRQRATVP